MSMTLRNGVQYRQEIPTGVKFACDSIGCNDPGFVQILTKVSYPRVPFKLVNALVIHIGDQQACGNRSQIDGRKTRAHGSGIASSG
jgi:hypothetical protein